MKAIMIQLGFDNPSQTALAMVRLFVKMIENPKQPLENIGADVEDQKYITEMFSELADFEPTPEAGHAPRRSCHRSIDTITSNNPPRR